MNRTGIVGGENELKKRFKIIKPESDSFNTLCTVDEWCGTV